MPGCCGLCSSWDLVPEGYNELSVAELQQLYAYSTNINGGRLIVQGLFARADCQNTNGRVYPKSILQREVARFKEQHVAKGSALGELNHPSYFSSYFRHLNLPNVSHQVLGLRWRGPELWGTLEVLPTPAGLLLSELYSKGIKLGVSSRGWASVVTDPHSKQVVVEPDYQLITFDFVPEPSNAGAYVVPICKRYRKRLPDQAAAVSISYLGIGSISMVHLQSLPPASVLRKWLKHTSRAMDAAAKHPGQVAASSTAAAAAPSSCAGAAPPQEGMALTAPPAAQQGGSSSSNTHGVSMLGALGACSQQVLTADTPLGGGVVLGCHYQVLQKPWLPLDTAVRQFKVHLSLMATKARLHQQQQQHAGPVLDHSQLQQQQSLPLPRQQQHVQQQPQQQPQQQRFGSPQRQEQQQLQRLALEQPLLVRDPSDSSSSPSSQLPSVAGAEQGQPPGVVLPPAILAQVACDDAYSDSSLGPGTPKADPLVLLAQAPPPQQPQPPLPQQLLQQRQRVGVGAALQQASAC